MSVFEYLRDELGCMYISDMRFGYRTSECDREIKRCFHSLEYFLFSTDELINLFEYLFGERIEFCDSAQAKQYFLNKAST